MRLQLQAGNPNKGRVAIWGRFGKHRHRCVINVPNTLVPPLQGEIQYGERGDLYLTQNPELLRRAGGGRRGPRRRGLRRENTGAAATPGGGREHTSAFPLLLVFFKPRRRVSERVWVHGRAGQQCRRLCGEQGAGRGRGCRDEPGPESLPWASQSFSPARSHLGAGAFSEADVCRQELSVALHTGVNAQAPRRRHRDGGGLGRRRRFGGKPGSFAHQLPSRPLPRRRSLVLSSGTNVFCPRAAPPTSSPVTVCPWHLHPQPSPLHCLSLPSFPHGASPALLLTVSHLQRIPANTQSGLTSPVPPKAMQGRGKSKCFKIVEIQYIPRISICRGSQ